MTRVGTQFCVLLVKSLLNFLDGIAFIFVVLCVGYSMISTTVVYDLAGLAQKELGIATVDLAV